MARRSKRTRRSKRARRSELLESLYREVQAHYDLYTVLRLCGHDRRARRVHAILHEKINFLEELAGCPWWELGHD